MVVSCFFCQNLLSDYIEGMLPTARHQDLKGHLEACKACGEVHHDLVTTLDLLHSLPSRQLSHEMELRITEASQAGKNRLFTRARVSRFFGALAVPVLLFAVMVYSFPKVFPWFSQLRTSQDSSQFARYFPLLQGAAEIVEEQANWLHIREPFMRSLWEEGGLSPEEFEKSFQSKPTSGGGETKGVKEEEP